MRGSEGHGERVCARDGCGQTFTPKTVRRVYCSDSCRALTSVTKRSVSESGTARPAGRRPAAGTAAPAVALTWEPPAEPRYPCMTTEPCPHCDQPLKGTRTLRACTAHLRVTPRGVRAPYERDTGTGRQVKSQRERDLDAIRLAKRKGFMLAQLDRLGADDRLHPESRPVVEWFAEEVKTAAAGARLDELAALLPDADIRRAHWWQGTPAEIEPADYNDDGQADELAADEPLALGPAPARATDYAGAMAVLGWRMTREPVDGCQVGACGAPWAEHIATASWAGGLACRRHLAALDQVITGRSS